jgi:hypothetical protein
MVSRKIWAEGGEKGEITRDKMVRNKDDEKIV